MTIEPIAWECKCGGIVPVSSDTCSACGGSRHGNLGAACGKCGSDDVHFEPCEECEYAQTFTCFGCGAMYHLPEASHDADCSLRPA